MFDIISEPMFESKEDQLETIYNAYLELDEAQRFLVQVFAVAYEPLSRQKARELWIVAMGLQHSFDRIKPPKPKDFNTEVRQRVESELLREQRGYGACCNNLIVDLVVRDALRMKTFEPIAIAVSQLFPVTSRYPGGAPFFRNEAQFMREVRIAVYRQDLSAATDLFSKVQGFYWQMTTTLSEALRDILTNPLDIDWLDSLSEEFFELGVTAILDDSVRQCEPATEVFELLADYCVNDRVGVELHLLYAEQLWLRGEIEQAVEVLHGLTVSKSLESRYYALMGVTTFLTGETAAAIAHYKTALKATGKSQKAQTQWFEQPAAAIYFFALLEAGTPNTLQEAEKYALLIQRQASHWLYRSISVLFALLQQQQSKLTHGAQRFSRYELTTVGLPALIEIYSLHWLNIEDVQDWMSLHLLWQCQVAIEAEYNWLTLETAELLVNYQPESPFTSIVDRLRSQADTLPLLEAVERKEAWERSLDALTALNNNNTEMPAAPIEPAYRLLWKLRFHSLDNWSLTPVEQKISVKGGWTKGKSIAIKRLNNSYSRPDYFTKQDDAICEAIDYEYDNSRYYSNSPDYFFTAEALQALVGHPHVVWEDAPEVKVDVVAGEPELRVKRLGEERLQLSLSPQITRRDVVATKETLTRLKVISVTEEHKRIAEVLGPANRLEVPAKAEERVLKAIASIASLVTVQSDIGGGVEAEAVPANATPHVHLLPAGAGLKVSLLIHPFPEGGTYYRPGEGGETVIAVVDGQRLKTQRDLTLEIQNAETVSSHCPVLLHYEPQEGEWLIEEPHDCLELLLQLQQLGEKVVIEWPEGESFKVSKQLSSRDFQMNIRRQKDWFAASGKVQVSEDHVLDLQQLMALLENTSGQFVPLQNGEFLALTDEFRQRLQTLSRLSQRHGKGLRINGLAALAMEDLVDDFEQVKVDKAWKAHLQKIKKAQKIEPQVPNTLQATLRDYQTEGFVWLSRLANWGVGACLADDMGLGKTLQGLAVMLSRAADGPALVIAPTSVCTNWQSEAERFAPSLRIQRLGEGSRDNRQMLLDELGANDLLVCSYGLVQQEEVAEILAGVTWETIVLDEAQAIKNHATKRSQAVMALQGTFKIIMTGTPIENHLGELWNLFRFINPGLLGSLDSFKQKFANPIERDPDKAASEPAKEALRRLIRPFILRRTKDQVLQELPSRTEITLAVEPSDEEAAFYEALRREAVEKLKGKKDIQAGQKHLQVLAEIMKLRRACCNPSLVKPELAIPSTKLARFSELIEELLDNGHKALVFSQFVDHLKLLKAHLDEQQIAYQYLDGSTPSKKRKASVDAFQNGEGDVFLISLKAGGSGLNLTAADYVLHMDPWWNPAVEDQASDRAHRIGQQRPVTIYRLVTQGTIEDKIVSLHKAKRDLADSLLTGADISSKVSTDELLSLIQS
ncbi:MAG: DEAD/DEAH box helicase [Cyanobacteria bacterium J06623_4]